LFELLLEKDASIWLYTPTPESDEEKKIVKNFNDLLFEVYGENYTKMDINKLAEVGYDKQFRDFYAKALKEETKHIYFIYSGHSINEG